jgi:hypothetical protein
MPTGNVNTCAHAAGTGTVQGMVTGLFGRFGVGTSQFGKAVPETKDPR